jgi:uncharacterized protein (TIGR02611 family)
VCVSGCERELTGGDLSPTEGKERDASGARRAVDRVVAGCRRFRSAVKRNPILDLAYRVAVGVVGIAVIVLGIVALPAPGPGWAIIFLGLGILATEFEKARKVLHWVRVRYLAWVHWLARQGPITRLAVSAAILLLVVVCAWLVGAFAVVGGWFGIEWAWLKTPLAGLVGL